jgi:hypothetical protein
MLIRNFAPENYPAMVDIQNSLNIVWPEQPRTPEAWAMVDRNRSPKYNYRCWIAIEEGPTSGNRNQP